VSAALQPLRPAGHARSARALVEDLRLGDAPGPQGRPRVVAAMIASADGRAAGEGRSVALGHPADRALFRELRTAADALLVGTGTLRTERYAELLDGGQRAHRAGAGRPPDPLVATVSRGLDVPTEIPLFGERGARIHVYTAATGTVRGRGAQVAVHRLAPPDPPAVLRHLAAELGARLVLCEGGPTLLGALLAHRCLDDLFLTVAPLLVAGAELALVKGAALRPPANLRLRDVHRAGDHVFLHYGTGA